MPSSRSPAFIEPMVATNVSTLPEGDEWLYEVKWDGYRALILKDDQHVQIRSRRNNDLTSTYPGIAAATVKVKAKTFVLDGEIVAIDASGRPSFQALQHRKSLPNHTVVFYAFDLLHLNGEDLTRLPLEVRRTKLPTLLKGTGLLLSDALSGTPAQVIEAVGRLGLEGVIAKRKDSRYNAGLRTAAWVKLKLDRQQEFVVGGFRPGSHGIDALLVGVYEGKELRFVGKVRAGFTPHLRREVFAKLEPLRITKCPFVNLPTTKTSRWGSGVTAEDMKEMVWVRPKLVVQIRFVEWTADAQLRHAAFLGIREDKEARAVRREP